VERYKTLTDSLPVIYLGFPFLPCYFEEYDDSSNFNLLNLGFFFFLFLSTHA
jgi:hypothetical protein